MKSGGGGSIPPGATMATMTPEEEITYLRGRIRRHRALITALRTVLEGVNMRGQAGRKPTRYNAIMRCRELITEWDNDCGGETE